MAKTATTEAQASQIEQLIQTDPVLQQLRTQGSALKARPGATGKGDPAFSQQRQAINLQIAQRLEQLGVPLPENYAINLKSGDVDFQNWFERNWEKVVAAGIIGAGTLGVASAAGAFGGAAAGSAGAAPVAGGAGAGTAAGTAAGVGGAVAGSTPLWKDILKVGIPAAAGIGLDIYNTKTQADASKAATDAQAKAAEDALNFTKEQYADLKRRRAPFEAASLGSLQTLYRNMGLGELPSTMGSTGTPPIPAAGMPSGGMFPAGNLPPNIPGMPTATMPPMGGTLNALNAGTPTAMVKMRAPDGSLGSVPQDKVTQAVAAGGVVING